MNRKQAIALALAIAGTSAFAQEATSDIWMHAQSNKSFEQVRAELVQARKDGTIKFGSAGYMEKVASVKSRDQLRAEVASRPPQRRAGRDRQRGLRVRAGREVADHAGQQVRRSPLRGSGSAGRSARSAPPGAQRREESGSQFSGRAAVEHPLQRSASTGLVQCWSKPAACARARSFALPPAR